MPLLFAVTLFVSASLLFMVQPMVGKLVLPLLGGSPAVWNACMVFFQALLLLGYLYADRLTRQPDTRKQWYIHMGVMALPVAAFALAAVFSLSHRPIAVAESLAPSDGSAILSVLAILTVAIGVPFFVCSTSATLLQKWFTYTGHPSARDPYFLYAASNFGSLISLLGYPIFIEPNMTQGAQTWFWAAGFLGLFGLIAFCGRAAVNPLGVPPSAGVKQAAKQAAGPAVSGGEKPHSPTTPAGEKPPTWGRMAKWTLLAFVPSSLMLGVTFHMTTDIASIPLLWVGPLALYLVTFIIAFGKVPSWFRILIGNLAPVMILLLIFLMLSEVKPGTGLELLLYNLTFFAAAMMCHYELARDRPSPQYLTTYFLIMSFGGVLGGIFNSLIAPVIFTLSWEFPLALIVACFMVPRMLPADAEKPAEKPSPGQPKQVWLGGWVEEGDYWAVVVGSPISGLIGLLATLPAYEFVTSLASTVAVILGYNALYLFVWRPVWRWYNSLAPETRRRTALVLDIVIPVALGLIFWRLPHFLGTSSWYSSWVKGIVQSMTQVRLTPNTISVIILYAVPVMVCFFFVDRPVRFALCVAALLGPTKIREGSGAGVVHTERSFFGILKIEETQSMQYLIKSDEYILSDEDRRMLAGRYEYRRLVHGTTLHGTQVSNHDRHILDDFQLLTAANPWDNIAVLGAIQRFDMRQEPLTYYHRTGPVGAMFAELTRRGKDHEHVAMVGLGTGSAACYAQKGQKLTFYEIDPAVKRLVEKPWKVMNEKELKKLGSAPITDPEVRQLVEKLGGVTIHDQASYDEKVRVHDEEMQKYQTALRQYMDEFKRRKAAGEPPPDNRPEEPTRPPAVPEIGPFSYVDDARKRGAHIDFRMGDARLKLKETDDKYALLLVDAFSSDSIPVHLLTVEAVKLYLERITDDGILALHISNKYVKLEPVVAAIAKEHNLVARVWNDDAESRHGKTASSWVALARKPEHLGERLCHPISDLMVEWHHSFNLMDVMIRTYPDLRSAIVSAPTRQQETILAYLDKRIGDPQAQRFAALIRKYRSEYETLMTLLQRETGYGFRPLRLQNLEPWTDDYADVMRVMMISELQAVRKFFGLPTLDD